ncbi:MAG: sigma-70 family RNA polymerase sigma factor [Xanthomonadales bacterium]|nr:sigma-70 family RNA polymerase sigma factor [Xanthomonadales bacterium]
MLNISTPNIANFDIETVLSAITAGEPAAETALVRQYSRGLLLMLTQRCGDVELASDIHQDAFMVVLTRLRKQALDNPKQVKAFIHTTAVNLFINHFRKEKRRNTWGDGDAIDAAVDPMPDQVTRLEKKDTAELVHTVINELPGSRDRKILWLYFIDELEKPNICAQLDLSTEHFDRVLYRAKQRLRQKLEFQMRDFR